MTLTLVDHKFNDNEGIEDDMVDCPHADNVRGELDLVFDKRFNHFLCCKGQGFNNED